MLGPIFTRELVTVPRRKSHFGVRVAQLGLLTILGVTAWQAMVGFDRDATLGETARFGTMLFQVVVFVQLLLLVFFAALTAAGAVSQEKDRRTFILLLITDMRDYEIVLGKLLGALLPITVLMLTAIPFLALLLLLGGIDPPQVLQAGAVVLASAYAAGSLGGLIALWRDKTFQALALSTLLLVLYECLVVGLGSLGGESLRTYLDPVAAMRSVLQPPPGGWTGLPPAYGFALAMLGWCVVLNGVGLWGLRRWNPSGEAIMQREGPGEDPEADMDAEQLAAFRAQAHAAPGALRPVWKNFIAWREIRTRAYGRRPLLIKIAFAVVLALITYFAVSTVYQPGGRPAFAAAYGLVPLTVLCLLLVAAQAVTSITSERDGGMLDLLLASDVSPPEFVFGKTLGVLYNTKEFLIPPILFAIFYAVEGLFTKTDPGLGIFDRLATNAAPLLAVVGSLVVLFAFAIALGLHVSLRLTSSRLAIGHVLGTVFFLCVGTLLCIYLISLPQQSFANQWVSFIGFLAVGIGGFWWVLRADSGSNALTAAAVACPLAMFYTVTNILIAKPGTDESADPLVPFLALSTAFGFTTFAMIFPLVTEFDVALGRTTAPMDE
ncbi:MAG TPA: ABC transporter permease subunit [Fimbriiglobus sp.]